MCVFIFEKPKTVACGSQLVQLTRPLLLHCALRGSSEGPLLPTPDAAVSVIHDWIIHQASNRITVVLHCDTVPIADDHRFGWDIHPQRATLTQPASVRRIILRDCHITVKFPCHT
jgi:hypothetical protein